MKRKKELRADPEKMRAWQQRSQQKARDAARKKPSTPIKRARSRPKGRDSSDRPKMPSGMTALEWREAVWFLDSGRCVGCGKKVPLRADRWVWQAHHPLAKQILKKRGHGDLVRDPRFGVVACRRCHERHESATDRIPAERLPTRVRQAVLELGNWAVDLLDRAHPPAGATGPGPE